MVDECRRLLATGRVRDPDRLRGRRGRRGRRATTRVVAADAIPAGWTGLDIGPETAASYADDVDGRGDGVVERPDGGVRARAVRGRHPDGGRRRGRLPRASPSSAAATARRRSAIRARRSRRPREHRRWRVARVHRARRPARPASPPRSGTGDDPSTASRSSPATGRCTTTTWWRSRSCRSSRTGSSEATTSTCDVVVCPPFTDAAHPPDPDRGRPAPDPSRRAELPLGGPGRVHRRGEPADARQAQRPVRDRRPLGTPPALRRDRRDGATGSSGRCCSTDDADRLRGGDARGAGGGRDRRRG